MPITAEVFRSIATLEDLILRLTLATPRGLQPPIAAARPPGRAAQGQIVSPRSAWSDRAGVHFVSNYIPLLVPRAACRDLPAITQSWLHGFVESATGGRTETTPRLAWRLLPGRGPLRTRAWETAADRNSRSFGSCRGIEQLACR